MIGAGLKRNAVWNVLEVLVSTAVLFVMLRLIIAELGVEALGIWSLVLASISVGRFADLGVTGGVGRYVATLTAKGASPDDVRAYIDTALILNIGLYGALAAALYWPAWWGLGLTLEGPQLAEARALLPYAIGSFALQAIASVVVAALIGFHRSDLKSIVMMGGLVVQALFAVALIGAMGLQGVAAGQVAQYLVLLVVGWALVVRLAGGDWAQALPNRLRKTAFKDLVGFGMRMQTLNVANFTFDPIVKFTFAAIGGVAALGIYDLMLRGLLQVRQIILAPTQNLTPLLAAAHHEGAPALRRAYEQPLALLIAAAAPVMALIVVGSPILSLIWLGRVDQDFVVYSLIGSVGWLVNMIAVPAWHLGVATGRLRWNIAGAALTSGGALMLSYSLGLALGGLGVVIGAMAALTAGAMLTWVMNTRYSGLPVLPEPAVWIRLRRQVTEQLGKMRFRKRAS